jgi:type VI secretion system protein ImpC
MLYDNIFVVWRICDDAVKSLLNAILHDVEFQRLEASWRGLRLLVLTLLESSSLSIKIKLLNINFGLLENHLSTSVKLEEAILFEKIFHQEYNQAGGEPYSLLIGDYFFQLEKPSHLKLLELLSNMAASAFTPFVISIKGFDEQKNSWWDDLRVKINTNFIEFLYPDVLMRCPYTIEEISECEHYLWGNVCYDYAICVVKSFQKTGWFDDLYKKRFNIMQHAFRSVWFSLDSCEPVNRKGLIKYYLTPERINWLNEQGITVINESECQKKALFYFCPAINIKSQKSVFVPLPVLLCVVRFIHCLKIMFRNKIGYFSEVEKYKNYLQRWLLSYCSQRRTLPNGVINHKYPLSYAAITLIQLSHETEFSNHYELAIEIQPHFYYSNIINVRFNRVFQMQKLKQ